jgi:hypothetical protein
MEMRTMERVAKQQIIQYQRAMINNKVPKTTRLYQRLLLQDQRSSMKLRGLQANSRIWQQRLQPEKGATGREI